MTVDGDAEQLNGCELPETGGVAAAAVAHDDGDVYVPPAGPVDGDPDRCRNAAGEPGLGMDRCNYAAELENLDALFAALLADVDFATTLVCILSDHGELLGDHGAFGKSKPWQGAIGVPLVCAGAGVAANRTVDDPVTTVDLAATVLAATIIAKKD